MSRRTFFAVLATVALAALSGVLVWIAVQPPPGPRGPAADEARSACAFADRFTQLVERDAPVVEVKRELALATAAAARAVKLDPVWVPLQSGLETFEVALDHDDPGSANVAVRVVRARCRVFHGREVSES